MQIKIDCVLFFFARKSLTLVTFVGGIDVIREKFWGEYILQLAN